MSSSGLGDLRLVRYATTRSGPPHIDMLRRAIGTTDIDGKGTKHPVERQADPFVILDEAVLPPNTKPPFGAHPHAGLVAVTIPFNPSFAGLLWDNISELNGEKEYGPLWSNGLFQIKAGRGVVHDEGRDVDKEVILSRVPQSVIDRDVEKNVGIHLLQLWFNPGIGGSAHNMVDHELEPAEKVLLDSSEIPEVMIKSINDESAIRARVLMGEFDGKKSPAKTWDADLLLLDCTVDGKASGEFKITFPDRYSTLWVYNLKTSGGKIKINDNAVINNEYVGLEIDEQELAIREWGKQEVCIENDNSITVESDTNRRFIIGAGKPIGLPWVKLLGNDGALLGPSEEFVRNKMKEFESNKKYFGTT